MVFALTGMDKLLSGLVMEKLCLLRKSSSNVSLPLIQMLELMLTIYESIELPRGRTLDGELYIGRNRFDETSGIVRSLRSPRWDEIKYMVRPLSPPLLYSSTESDQSPPFVLTGL